MTMIRMKPDDWYELTGRGPVATFSKDTTLPDGITNPRQLIDRVVFIGDRTYRVKGLEHWAIVCDGECHHPFGLLLEHLEHYWDGFIDNKRGLPGFMQ